MKQRRIAYLEWLRVLAALAVVVMHLCATPWNGSPVGSGDWQALTVLDGLARWPVPVFLMITGAVFPEKPVKELFRKSILRIAGAFVFWSGLYAAISLSQGADGAAALREFLLGHYHLWYLYYLAGIYMICPFLRKITEDEGLTRYFLALSMVFANILPRLAEGAALISPEAGALASDLMGRGKIYFVMGYVFYFVLGSRLHRRDFTPGERRSIYLLGILGAAVTVFGTIALSVWKGYTVQLLFEPATPNVAAMAAAIFVFAKYHLKDLPAAVKWLAGGSFGVYLSHPMLIEGLERLGISAVSVHPMVAVPVLAAAVTAGCLLLTALVRRLPGFGKYVV